MSDYEKAKADLDYVLEEDGHSSAAVEKLLGLCDYIDQQEQRIRELEAALEEIKRKSERLDAQFYGIACRALEQPR